MWSPNRRQFECIYPRHLPSPHQWFMITIAETGSFKSISPSQATQTVWYIQIIPRYTNTNSTYQSNPHFQPWPAANSITSWSSCLSRANSTRYEQLLLILIKNHTNIYPSFWKLSNHSRSMSSQTSPRRKSTVLFVLTRPRSWCLLRSELYVDRVLNESSLTSLFQVYRFGQSEGPWDVPWVQEVLQGHWAFACRGSGDDESWLCWWVWGKIEALRVLRVCLSGLD